MEGKYKIGIVLELSGLGGNYLGRLLWGSVLGPQEKPPALWVTAFTWADPAASHAPGPLSAVPTPIHHHLESVKLGPQKTTEKG